MRSDQPGRLVPLNAAGMARAAALSHALQHVPISHVIVSQWQRTQQTGALVANAHGVVPQQIDATDYDAIVDAANARSSTVLIVGHSNTVPELVNRFADSQGPPIASNDFDDMFVVERKATLHLQY